MAKRQVCKKTLKGRFLTLYRVQINFIKFFVYLLGLFTDINIGYQTSIIIFCTSLISHKLQGCPKSATCSPL